MIFAELAKLNWLKTNVEDWTKVSQYWNDTFEARQRQLSFKQLSVQAYINNYLCLQNEAGHLLVNFISYNHK